MVQPVPQTNKLVDPGYYVWCGSVTKGKDGKFYMLYSRWPLGDGFFSWPVTSEIAVAVSAHPGGPFKHLKVALPARGTPFWDGAATHNPAVIQHKGKYYLFYTGTHSTAEIRKPVSASGNWWHYRNSQRIGLAVADTPDGEWKRLDHPVLSVSPDPAAYDALMVSNPAATIDDKGRVILLYKQVGKSDSIKGGAVRFGVAFSDSFFGPYRKHNNPIFEINDGGKDWMVAEDPFVWFQHGAYLAIVRDVVGKFTGDPGAWALMVSKNGTDWQPAKHPKVIGSTFYWEGGVAGTSKLERPCLYLEKGVPKYLYGATRADKEQALSFNVAVPLRAAECMYMLKGDAEAEETEDGDRLSPPGNVPTILALGDSITQGGGKTFVGYRDVLIPELRRKHVKVEFIGPNRDAMSAHAGYSNKNAGDLRSMIKDVYSQYPADIVLLHAGHNNFSEKKPVPGVIRDTEAILRTIWTINPKAVILLAQVIPSGKLPKYSYIPELNVELAALADRLAAEGRPIVLVNQAEGFDWTTDTISDHVHPNASGAKKMADQWMAALLPILKNFE